jgi:hypothetical protein
MLPKARRAARSASAATCPGQPLGLERDVGSDLVLKIVLGAAAEHQAFSGVGPGSMTRAMDSTRRFQRVVSTANCLRPVAVSE